MLTKSFPFNYMLKSKFSLSRHFEYANEQIIYHFWLCIFLRNSRRKSGVGKMNGTVITNRLQNSFKIKDNNMYGSLYYWNFRTSSFKQVACLILLQLMFPKWSCELIKIINNKFYFFVMSTCLTYNVGFLVLSVCLGFRDLRIKIFFFYISR
jgi:hypothetical protein